MVPVSIAVLSVGLVVAVVAEVWGWHGGFVRLPLPIAGYQGLPVPLVTWAAVGIYAWIAGRLLKFHGRALWTHALRLGFGVHGLALLASLARPILAGSLVELSVWYVRYWYALWTVILLLSVWAAWMIATRGVAGGDSDRTWLFFFPFALSAGVAWAHAARIAPPVALIAAAGGVMSTLGSRLGVVRKVWSGVVGAWRNERIFLIVVALLALAFRLFYATRVMSNPDVLNTGSDGPTYDALAWAMARGEPPPAAVPWWALQFCTPGYVRFLALLYTLFGRNYFLVCAVQSVIGAGACLLLYDVAKRLFGRPVARVSALFGAVNFLMVFSAAAIGHQALDLFWTLAVVWCLVRYTEEPSRWGRWMPGVGLLLGWAAVTREGNIAFWLFLLGWFLLGVRAALGWRRALLHVAGLSLGFCLVVAPFLRGSGGGIRQRLDLQWFYQQYASTPINTWFNPWRDPAGAWVLLREQPVTVVLRVGEAMAGNFNAMFLNQDYGSFDPVFLARGSLYYFGMWWYAYGLAFVGLGLVLRQAWRAPIEHLGWWLIVGLLVSRASVHLFFQSAYRHRAPLEPYLIMLAAVGLTQLLPSPQRVTVS